MGETINALTRVDRPGSKESFVWGMVDHTHRIHLGTYPGIHLSVWIDPRIHLFLFLYCLNPSILNPLPPPKGLQQPVSD